MHGTGVIDVDQRYEVGEYDYSYENPSIPIGDLDPDYFGGCGTSESGYRVTHDSALRVPAVWQAVTRISSDVAKLPLHLYRRKGEDERTLDRRHPSSKLVRSKPNGDLTPFKFWRRLMVHQLIWGNAYAFIVWNRQGRPTELLPLLPDRTEPRRVEGELLYRTIVDGREEWLPSSRVLHLEGICVDNLCGADVTKYARDAWGLALASQGFAGKFFRQGGRVGGTLSVPSTMTKKAADNLELGFRKTYDSPDAAFRTVVLRENAQFHAAQRSFRETQLVDGRRESVRDVARYFNIQPGKLGEETRVSYGSKSEDNRDYLDTTLSPHLVMIAQVCDAKLLTETQRNSESHYFEHKTEALLRMNAKERYETYGIGISGMFLKRNEARKAENLPPVEGGDEMINPNISEAPQPSDDEDDAQASLLNKTVHHVLAALGRKSKSACTQGTLLEWVERKLPKERETIDLAIGPVVKCIAISKGRDHEKLSGKLSEIIYTTIHGNLNRIIDEHNESEFRSEVESFFDHLASQNYYEVLL